MNKKKQIGRPKFNIGDKVWIIERDLSIVKKKIVGYKEVEGKLTYELDVRFCRDTPESELLKTKAKAEVKKKDFIDNLKFRFGDLVVFEYKDYSKKERTIGRITKIEYSESPYEVKGSYRELNNVSDEDILLKVKNEFIEDFGNLQELYKEFEEKEKELIGVINLIHRLHGQLEKELETSIRKQYSIWHWNKSKPLFKDRFSYEANSYD